MIGGEHLYIAQSHTTGAFKVGRSSNPERRLRDLQVGSPFELRLILVVEGQGWRERKVHAALHGYRSQGTYKGEWFIEPGLSMLPDDLYDMLDLEMVTWWETEKGPIHGPGPPTGFLLRRRRLSDPGVEVDD
jgi:hypothetical protein